MFCGIADMEVLEYIPEAHLNKFKFWDSDIVLIDSNIGKETLLYVLSKCKGLVIYEPISTEKSERLLDYGALHQVNMLKPNVI